LRRAIGALPGQQGRLIEQLFWEEGTESELAASMGTNQSTVNRRKRGDSEWSSHEVAQPQRFQNFSA
jgi:DNA-directed RNA polymerase specialized sigma24 family protein